MTPAAAPEVALARRALRVTAVVEPLTLLVLLANLATAYLAGLAAAVGPLHGSASMVGIGATWVGGGSRRARALALIPAVGALLAARRGLPDMSAYDSGAARAAVGTERSRS